MSTKQNDIMSILLDQTWLTKYEKKSEEIRAAKFGKKAGFLLEHTVCPRLRILSEECPTQTVHQMNEVRVMLEKKAG